MPRYETISVTEMVFFCFILSVPVKSQPQCPSFRQFFSKCQVGSPKFDECLTKALNDVRPCLKVGDPSMKIPVLEPITYGPKPVHESINLSVIKIHAELYNVIEYAWANSTYLRTKTNLAEQKIDIYQRLPYKLLWGDIKLAGETANFKANRTAQWKVELFEVKQRTTIKRIPSTNKLQLSIKLLSVKDIKFQLKNAIYDREVEMMLNAAIHRFWRLFFEVLKPAIYNIINGVQTNLVNDIYSNIDLNLLFTPMK